MRRSHAPRRVRPGSLAAVAALLVAAGSPPPARGASPGADSVAVTAGAHTAAPPPRPDCFVARLPLSGHQLLFRLPYPFLRPGSDSVWTVGATWRRGVDYEIESTRGELRLLRAPAAGETLVVAACRLLDAPPLVLQTRAYRPVAAPPETVAARGIAAPSRPATARGGPVAAGASLQLTGNKSVAVDFGTSQDAFLRQSLDLTVSGKLSNDLELAGVLTDRNTPLGAAGATQDIQSLDRVLLELRAPQGGASLGDITLDMTDGEFARLSRRLQGARGAWTTSGLGVQAAASSTQGEFRSVQFFGQDGRQGPYALSDREGRTGIAVVALSEVVNVDGRRMTRGETADYFMDYDRGELTFTNRRPISSASRITVEYQFSLDRFRRNLAAAGTHWERGPLRLFSNVITEGDDRGRALGLPLDESDRLVLRTAGDSASRALGPGVTAGRGDYDLVSVAGSSRYAYAGIDSGDYAVSFAFVGAAQGDYADSTRIAGRRIFRYVGAGLGDHRIGRALPLPDAHQLWSLGAAWREGGLRLEGEGALSRLDLNTFSSRDDADNQGRAGQLRAAWEGAPAGPAGRALKRAGVSVLYRSVDAYFQPFTRLESPFANEDWGLPLGTGLDRQERLQVGAQFEPHRVGELRGELSRLRLPSGFTALRRGGEWRRDGSLSGSARWERVESDEAARRFASGGREKRAAELRLRAPWLEPAVRADWDERRSPSDTGRVGDRYRLVGGELRSPSGRALVVSLGNEWRLDDRLRGGAFEERYASRTWSLNADGGGSSGSVFSLGWQRRDRLPRAEPERVRSDLGYSRLQLATADRRTQGHLSLEVTSEAQSVRRRVLTFVGGSGGAYDSLGNPMERGDYNLSIEIGSQTERVSRAAASTHFAWQWGTGAAWRGSRSTVDLESDARRRGELRGDQLALLPGAAIADAGLSGASALLRLDQELAPDSPLGGLRLLIERRASADRSFANFEQTLDGRAGTLRWRARPAAEVTVEAEGRAKRDQVRQEVPGGSRYERRLTERGGTLTLARTSAARWRLAVVGEGAWTQPDQEQAARVLRAGAEGWLALGARARLEANGRRAWLEGDQLPTLLPVTSATAFAPWEGTLRADYRLPPGTTASLSVTGRTRLGLPAEAQGRLELRVFF